MSDVESARADEDKLFQQLANVFPMYMLVLTKYLYLNVLGLMVSNGKTKLSFKQSISPLKLFL